MRSRGIATRIALAALASAAIGLLILAVGVTVVGGQVFTDLMMQAGDSAEHARAMYDDSVTTVVIAAVAVAALASVGLAVVMARMLARPLREVGGAARRIADGDYAARVPRDGPEEIASLADSFNQMAASLEEQERMRRDFIANAAHELRTPLTNLQGYLEALRDGVIVADRCDLRVALGRGRATRPPVALARCARRGRRRDQPADAPRRIDLAAAVRSAVELAQPAIERAGLRLSVEVPASLPARADPDHLAQVLANLLSNAVRYTPTGGTVTRPRRAAARRPARLGREQRRRDPGRRPRARVRALLPGREVARPGARRGRDRPRDRQAARRGERRPGRGGVGRRPDAVLVQPAGVGSGAESAAHARRVRAARRRRGPPRCRRDRATGSAGAARPRAGPRRRR